MFIILVFYRIPRSRKIESIHRGMAIFYILNIIITLIIKTIAIILSH